MAPNTSCTAKYAHTDASVSLLLTSVDVENRTGEIEGLATRTGACYGNCRRQAHNNIKCYLIGLSNRNKFGMLGARIRSYNSNINICVSHKTSIDAIISAF